VKSLLLTAAILCNAYAPSPWALPYVPQLAWEQPPPSEPGRLLVGWIVAWRYEGDVEYTPGPARLCAPDYDREDPETIEVCYGPHALEPALRSASPWPGYVVEMVVWSVWLNLFTLEVEASVPLGPVRFCWPNYRECDRYGCVTYVAPWP